MAGGADPGELLSAIAPELHDGEFVFCAMSNGRYGDYTELAPLASFHESEGLSLLIPRSSADEHGIRYESVFKGITLTVHSSLDAVGLTAAVSVKLAEQGISANVIAGYHHDHVFVPASLAEKALAALGELAGGPIRKPDGQSSSGGS